MAVGTTLTKVLVISEEPKSAWRHRRDELEIGDHVHILARPFMGRPSFAQWQSLVLWAAQQVADEGYGLVVIDTLAGLWNVVNENDASEVMQALTPTHTITDAGAGWFPTRRQASGCPTRWSASRR